MASDIWLASKYNEREQIPFLFLSWSLFSCTACPVSYLHHYGVYQPFTFVLCGCWRNLETETTEVENQANEEWQLGRFFYQQELFHKCLEVNFPTKSLAVLQHQRKILVSSLARFALRSAQGHIPILLTSHSTCWYIQET